MARIISSSVLASSRRVSFSTAFRKLATLARRATVLFRACVVRAAFSQRRKTLLNALQGGALEPAPDVGLLVATLEALGVDPRARAESLAPRTLLALARRLAEEEEA